MGDSIIIEVYENQVSSSTQGWICASTNPWTLKSFEECNHIDDFQVPSNEWCWTSNWKYERSETTDKSGWEYATNHARFKVLDRQPKITPTWNSSARRRMWTRTMCRKMVTEKITDLMPSIQVGLQSIHSARCRMEEIVKKAPEAAESTQMQILAQPVRKNIEDILQALDQAEKQNKNPSVATVIKKLRNDVIKEKVSIERVLDPTYDTVFRKPNTNTLRKSTKLDKSSSFMKDKPKSDNPFDLEDDALEGQGQGFRTPPLQHQQKTVGMGSKANFSLPSTKGSVDGATDGVFLDRTAQEREIESRLIAVDESEVMQEIIEDRSKDIIKMNRSIVEVNEMFVDLSRLVQQQQIYIDTVFNNVEVSHTATKEAFNNIVQADSLHKQASCLIS